LVRDFGHGLAPVREMGHNDLFLEERDPDFGLVVETETAVLFVVGSKILRARESEV
jgi:hypothetical protein